MIYVCSDNNKCLGCSGANVLLYPVESAEAQRRGLHGAVCLWKLLQNAKVQFSGSCSCPDFLCEYDLLDFKALRYREI